MLTSEIMMTEYRSTIIFSKTLTRKVNSLVNTVSYYKEFGFSSHNIDSVVYYLDDQSIMAMNM